MLALAIVLLLIIALLVVASFAGSSEELVIEFLNVTITTSVGGVFVTGVVCGLVALASALALRRSWRQHQARTEEVRELRRLAGVPDPAAPGDTEHASAGSGTTSQAAAEPSKASGSESERNKAGEAGTDHAGHAGTARADNAGTARADIAASSSGSNDTAPIPDPEDPPRT